MMIPRLPSLSLLLATLLLSATAQADPLWQEPPANPVILTVTGDLACCPSGTVYFDLARLDALPQTEVNTQTPWTDQPEQFRGVRLSELLERLGAKGSEMDAMALNDYSTHFSSEAALRYQVILATRKNDQLMRVRDKGPIWIIYPLDDYPELNNEAHHHAMVWQLKSLKIGQ